MLQILLNFLGDSALHIAVRNGDKRFIELILENGGDAQKKNKKKQTVIDLCNHNQDLLQYIHSVISRQKVTKNQLESKITK